MVRDLFGVSGAVVDGLVPPLVKQFTLMGAREWIKKLLNLKCFS